MAKTSKNIHYTIVAAAGIGILCLGYLVLARFVALGDVGPKHTREELQRHFVQHAHDFEELVSYFRAIAPQDGGRMIRFGSEGEGLVDLNTYRWDQPITNSNNGLGGDGLGLDSPELDSAMRELGWTKQDIVELEKKLVGTECRWIRTTEVRGKPIEIYFGESGMGSFSYIVFEYALSDSLYERYGPALSETGFGKTVALHYSSAL